MGKNQRKKYKLKKRLEKQQNMYYKTTIVYIITERCCFCIDFPRIIEYSLLSTEKYRKINLCQCSYSIRRQIAVTSEFTKELIEYVYRPSRVEKLTKLYELNDIFEYLEII